MAVLTEAADLIRSRIAELDAEKTQLEAALKAITKTSGPSARAAQASRTGSRSTTPTRSSRKRAGRGQRRDQVLTVIQKNPGARPSEIAREIGIRPQQVHALLNKLKNDKLVKKQGQGYAMAATGTSK